MGGTIEFFDPDYDVIRNLMNLDSTIEYYFKNIIKPHFEWSTFTVTQKDSRDLLDDDRQRLADAISNTDYENILITHGTFTMVETARFIQPLLPKNKTVIFTGSMIPISGFTTSDAGFNLGFAISAFDHLKPGVYLAMNGGVLSTNAVEKNKDLFRFE
jgi:L-asparaginase